MGLLEEVKSMKNQGISEKDIVGALQERGVPYREISEALAQSKIKAAVEEPPIDSQVPAPTQYSEEYDPNANAMAGMQQSMLQPEFPIQPKTQEISEYVPPETNQPYSQEYSQYENYPQQGISSETITEIAEQVISEKMTEMRKHLNKITDFKTTIESKTESIEDRLKRIEKVVDALQVSVLKKIGDHINNVEDIKREIIETQKSFSKIIPEISKHPHHSTKHEHAQYQSKKHSKR